MATGTPKGLRASEIKDILDRALEEKKVNFLGVFARDQVPQITSHMSFPACLVVNSAPASHGGEHWLALYFLDSTHCEFFDSYAFNPGFYGLSDYLSKFTITAEVDHPLQSIESTVCGHYCIHYLVTRADGYPLSTVLRSFTLSDQKWNDRHVYDIVKNLNLSRTPMQCSICTCPNAFCISRCDLLCKCILCKRHP